MPDMRTEMHSLSRQLKASTHAENFTVLKQDEKFCSQLYFEPMLFSCNKDLDRVSAISLLFVPQMYTNFVFQNQTFLKVPLGKII